MIDPQKNTYKVLARKYRPLFFKDVVGQEPIIQALTHALKNNKIGQAYMFSGTRGVGKTTLARLFSRAVNCLNLHDSENLPCGTCEPCQAILKESFIDVIEMDAASHTGVDDMRGIIENARYKPVLGRYKVYIIDEVHMLSKSAFNALLKTLEEPPLSTLFLFATTELKRVPLTILSRCQRYEVKPLSLDNLKDHLKKIANLEALNLEESGALILAQAAGGSVRDSLSLLDQAALLYPQTPIGDKEIKTMLGLSDSSQLELLFQDIACGQVKEALKKVQHFYELGLDALSLLQDLLELIYQKTLETLDVTHTSSDQETLSIPVLTRLWQMLMKGVTELQASFNPQQALEMLIIRVCYTSTLPTPSELLETFKQDQPQHDFKKMQTFEDVVKLFEFKKEPLLACHLRDDVGLIEFQSHKITLQSIQKLPGTFTSQVENKLKEWTGEAWKILLKEETQEPAISLKTKEDIQKKEDFKKVLENPLVKEATELFQNAHIEIS
jgi:DNA polymerase III subunit gamma/tau